MKLTVFLWVVLLLNAKADSIYAQKITLSVKNASLEQVFEEITKQTGYDFFYNTQMLENTRGLTFSVKNTPLDNVLKICLNERDFTYFISANTIVVKRKVELTKSLLFSPSGKELVMPEAIEELQRQVTGVVTDKVTKEPLAGVTIKVKNGTTAATTDSEGRYSIAARNADVLQATFLGYETAELTVGSNTKLDFALNQSLNNLDEVVVVGYGTQAKRDITGAITSVSSRQIMERTPINVYEALQGQSPGVQVDQSSGAPGAASSVIIRGIGTFGSGAGPLYIVDGAQGVNIDAINPMDIESIDILKDAASASIYGARGANGVIIITTKRGREGKATLNANIVRSYGTLAHNIASSNAEQRRIFDRKLSSTGTIALPADSLNPGFNADANAMDAVTRTAKKTDATVSLGGGSQNLKFMGSFNYVGDESIILNSWSKQARMKVNIDYTPSPRFNVSSSFTFGLRDGNTVRESATLNEAYSRNPTYPIYLPDGSLAPTINGRQNPVAWALLLVNRAKRYDGVLYNKADVKLIDGLTWSNDITLGFNTSNGTNYIPNALAGAGSAVDRGFNDRNLGTNWLAQSYFSLNKNLSTNSVLTGVVGASAEKRFSSRLQMTGTTWVTDAVLTLNAAQTYIAPENSESANTAVGAWARLGYNYKRRYQLQATVRADASSRFGPQNRIGYFPSVGASWNFSDEPILASWSKILASGKLRASYGLAGNDLSLGNYDAIQQYTFGSAFYNGVSGVVLNSNFGNPNLSWEVNKQLNLGTDLSFLKGRLNLTVDYYRKTTEKLLYRAPLAVETGFANVSVNTGTVQNNGLEFLLNGYPVRNQNFQWNAAYSMSFNRGKVIELVNHTSILNGDGSLTQEGRPLGDFYGWRQLGVFAYDQSNAFDANWNQLTPVFNGTTFTGYTLNGQAYTGAVQQKRTNGSIARGGDVNWADLDKNGIIDDADRHIIGNAQPDWIAGITNNFTYKNISLAVIFYGSIGGNIYNRIDATQSNLNTTGITPRPYIILNSWSKQGDVTDVPAIRRPDAMGNMRAIGSRYVEDASWVRLRNVKLSYSLPTRLSSYIGARNVMFSVSGNNLLTWSNYIGFDPEMSFNDPLQMGVESSSRVPRKNEWIFGLNVNF